MLRTFLAAHLVLLGLAAIDDRDAHADAPAAIVPPPAPADPAHPKPTAKALVIARKHFQEAEAAKARGDNAAAASAYLAAYALFPEPEFYFDVAEVVRRAGDDASALAYYESYLALDPAGRGAGAARTAVAELQAKAEAAATALRAAEDEDRRTAEAAAQAARAAAAARQPLPAPVPVPPPARPGGGMRIAGLLTLGAGAFALGVGAGFGVRARGIANEAAGWDTFDPDRYDQGQAAERNMYVFTGIGAGALIAGGVLYYLGRHHAADATAVTIAPALGPDGLGLAAAGRF